MGIARPTDNPMAAWPPGTRQFEIDGGAAYLAVQVDVSGPTPQMIAYVEQIFGEDTGIPPMPTNYITCATTVIEVDEHGFAIGDTVQALHTLPPLTQYAEALTAAGHTLTEENDA